MKRITALVFALLAIAMIAVGAMATNVDNIGSDKIHAVLFQKWMEKFNKKYTVDEKDDRFYIFKENIKRIQARNIETDGIMTKFMDMTPAEFKKRFLSSKRPKVFDSMPRMTSEEMKQILGGKIVASQNVDWRTKGVVTRVKDQGYCGSCWAFSASGNVESQWALANHTLVELSEQQLVDCARDGCDPDDPTECNEGCDGGLMDWTWPWIIKNGGMWTEKSYPYYARDRKCDKTKGVVGAKISSWKLLSSNETEIAAWVAEKGPVSIGINADGLQFYHSGIYMARDCTSQMDHGVLIVGMGVQGSTEYWIVKNSWASDWGEQGYFRIIKGKKACGLDQDVSTSIV